MIDESSSHGSSPGNGNVSEANHPPKNHNPFSNSSTDVTSPIPSSQYTSSIIGNTELIKYPFKTINRILDDLKYAVPFMAEHSTSLLQSRPLEYSTELSRMTSNPQYHYDVLTLNNSLPFSPSIEKIDGSPIRVALIRGLIVRNENDYYHFRIIIVESSTNPFVSHVLDKHEYHIIPQSLLSNDDLISLRSDDADQSSIFDDAYYKSANSPYHQLLRVTIFRREFTKQELLPFIDQQTIAKRYSDGMKTNPTLSPDTIPNVIHCFKTLIKVLRGPILLDPNDSIKTISLSNPSLSATIDVQFLLERLGFTLNAEETELIPPNLVLLPRLKESFIRMIQELIYLGRIYGKSVATNDFQTAYSYSDNFNLVFGAIAEYDKHINQTQFVKYTTNELGFFINLSCSPYFQDELIIKCFENSVKSDPSNRLYYVDSLRSVASYKSSSTKLNSYIKNLSAQGEMIGFRDYVESMNAIGISVGGAGGTTELNDIDDDFVVAMYKTSFKDDPKNYQYYNNHLQVIAKVRQSVKLWEYIHNEIVPLNIALDELTIEEITEDDVVITAYEYRLDELAQATGFSSSANEIAFLNKSLLSVAVNRKSYLLLNYIETKLPEISRIPPATTTTTTTTASAYETFGVSRTSSDFELITAFQNKSNDTTSDIRHLRYSLKLIAESRKSDILFSFLKNGKVDPSLLPAENWPAGLDNIGNTCYLNSLLQYYFCIKPLRELILQFDESQVDFSRFGHRKIGGRRVEDQEITRSNQFIYHLRYLFDEMIHTRKRCVQPTKELAYLSFLALSQSVDFRDDAEIIEIRDEDEELEAHVVEEEQEVVDDDDDDDEPILVDSVSPPDDVVMSADDDIEVISAGEFSRSHSDSADVEVEQVEQVEEVEPVEVGRTGPPLLSISTDQMESTIEVGRQQDVTECIENVIFQIETALAPEKLEEDGEQIDLIKRLFYGKIKQTIVPVDPQNPTITTGPARISIERFFSLIINVSDHPKNIYDTLDNYFNEDLISLEEGLCKKSITVNELPDILQFHVQRVMFDKEKLMAYKSLEPIPFSDKIYLDRYLDTEDAEMLRLRQEVFQWKNEMSVISQERAKLTAIDPDTKLSIIESLKVTKKYLETIESDESIELTIDSKSIEQIELVAQQLSHTLEQYNERLGQLQNLIANQFSNYKRVGYTIFAIFIHRGEASYGHYWIYIKDPHRQDIYRKYNDEIITEVSLSEVFNFDDTNTATPYYIVYVKQELEKEYVDPLKRELGRV
ncbi:uncharacterized protein RJT21DRAFT_47941 [Scheffersomyces amazonensis]|uniref:uncharacterized protein n=1 Tax=Scheffersomyces amazonensis TaxID=1078765 RepID=UPI00315CBD80